MEKEIEKKEEPEITLEERFAAIDGILETMEQDGVTLDRAFSLYKQGIGQLKAANLSLDAVEKEMLVLTEDGQLEEF